MIENEYKFLNDKLTQWIKQNDPLDGYSQAFFAGVEAKELFDIELALSKIPTNVENRMTATEFIKLPKIFRDNYLKLAAESAAKLPLYGGNGDVVTDCGFYQDQKAIGYDGWITTIDGNYFIGLDGKIIKSE